MSRSERPSFQSFLSKVSRAVNAPILRRARKADISTEADLLSSDEGGVDSPIGLRENMLRRCDSAMIMMSVQELRREFPDRSVPPRLFFDHPTIGAAASFILATEMEE
jgi:hypothetical protein